MTEFLAPAGVHARLTVWTLPSTMYMYQLVLTTAATGDPIIRDNAAPVMSHRSRLTGIPFIVRPITMSAVNVKKGF